MRRRVKEAGEEKEKMEKGLGKRRKKERRKRKNGERR
jgi:hypothetical protein